MRNNTSQDISEVFRIQTQKKPLKSERLNPKGTYITLLVCDNIILPLFSCHLRSERVRSRTDFPISAL